ncbi:hypothetical protein JYP52_21180 [Nitratireductor aquibiodomus]|uniref:hypothetical protein n=1 Tax=Nitratireductor aquibiodomus TaxID=204799 RepID=UPI0019D3CBC3|nr:hypothetical protein [Nitratireductor aquibiodomus]MBN7763656.1 hypothetical protein [Nitratireductor aquibiodomus]
MKRDLYRHLDRLAAETGASGWTLVRAGRHAIVDFAYEDYSIRQVLPLTPGNNRSRVNARAWLRRAVGRIAA